MSIRLSQRMLFGFLLAAVAVATLPVVGAEKKQPPKITFDDHVKPIFKEACSTCHKPDKKSGDLDLTNYTNVMIGGGSGAVIEPGDSENSYLNMLVTHESEPYMPPDSPKIPDEMLETIRKWIDGGALENAGSKSTVAAKPKFDLGLDAPPTERPEVAPMPGRLVLEPVIRTASTTAVTATATSPWSPLAAVAGQKQVLLYHTQSLELVGVLPFPEGVPQVLKFSRNGGLLLAGGGQGGASGRVIVWNVVTGQRVFEIGDELDSVLAADISSDQTLIALGGPQRVVRIYSTETGQKLHELRKHTDWITALEFSPDSVLLATGDRNGGLLVWEGWTGREYLTLGGHSATVTDISWRSDSNFAASCGEDGNIRLWEMENGKQVKNWGAHGGGATSVEYARDARLVSSGRDRFVKLWDANGKQLRAFEEFGDIALAATLCDETDRVIGGDWAGAIRVWQAADGKRVGELTANPATLAQQLETAKAALAARQAEQQPLLQTFKDVAAAVDAMMAQLAAAQSAAKDAEEKSKQAAAKSADAKKRLAQAQQSQEAAKQAVATMEPGVALLAEATAKAQQAAQKLASDKELADLAGKLQSASQARSAQLEAQRKAVTEQTSVGSQATKDMTAADKEAKDAATGLAKAEEQAKKLMPQIKAAEEKAAAAKQAADGAGAAVTAAQEQIKRWQQEIEFAKQNQTAAQ